MNKSIITRIFNTPVIFKSRKNTYFNRFNDEVDQEELKQIKQRLIYRHIAWLYAHRQQLLVFTSWEHASQKGITAWVAKHFQDNFGIGLVADEVSMIKLNDLVGETEFKSLITN